MVTIQITQEILAWCSVINMGLLLGWILIFTYAHDWVYNLHRKWFQLSVERFDSIHYAGMAFYKIGIFLLNIVPYLALHIIE